MTDSLRDAAARLTAGAVWHPCDPDADPDALPCVEVAGAIVFAYVNVLCDPDSGEARLQLVVSVHLDNADALTRNEHDAIPLRLPLPGLDITTDPQGQVHTNTDPTGRTPSRRIL